MTQAPVKNWLTIIPMEFRDIPEFWQRDASLVCRASASSGTLAPARADAEYADALSAEITARQRGDRHPEEFSRRERFAAPQYAACVLALFDRTVRQAGEAGRA